MNTGRLVAFEGLDGCGKTTQLARLAATLRAAGHGVVETAEPTPGPFGRRIREMARSGRRVAPEEELRWFVEDRREHVRDALRPALAAGRVVLTDRYFLSTVAYQGARGLDWRRLIAEAEAEFPVPDLAILLELDPAVGLERARRRPGHAEGAFEEPAFLESVAAIYAALDRPWLERVPAAGGADAVEAAVHACLARRLGLP